MCARQPITQTPPALTGLTDHPPPQPPSRRPRSIGGAPLRPGGRRKVVRCLFGALDRAQQSALSTSPWGKGTSGPRGTVRGGGDKGCSVTHSSKCGLSAPDGTGRAGFPNHPPRHGNSTGEFDIEIGRRCARVLVEDWSRGARSLGVSPWITSGRPPARIGDRYAIKDLPIKRR